MTRYKRTQTIDAIQYKEGMEIEQLLEWEKSVGTAAYYRIREGESIFLTDGPIVHILTDGNKWVRVEHDNWVIRDAYGYFTVIGSLAFSRQCREIGTVERNYRQLAFAIEGGII